MTRVSGWNGNKSRFRALHLPVAWVIGKPEYVVFPDRPAHRIAKLISAQFGLGRHKVVASIEDVVTPELEDITVKTVGAGLSDSVHDCAAELAIFGIEAIGNQPEFRNRVEVGNETRAQVAAFADIASVHQKGVCRFALAVDGDIAGAQVSGTGAILLDA